MCDGTVSTSLVLGHTTKNEWSVEPTHVLDQLAHAGLCDRSSTKYLCCVFGGSAPCVCDISATRKKSDTVPQQLIDAYCLRRAIAPATFSDCSSYDIYLGGFRCHAEGVIRKHPKHGTYVIHLVCDVLEPVLRRLDTRNHLS